VCLCPYLDPEVNNIHNLMTGIYPYIPDVSTNYSTNGIIYWMSLTTANSTSEASN
jgi:hypothetical protein